MMESTYVVGAVRNLPGDDVNYAWHTITSFMPLSQPETHLSSRKPLSAVMSHYRSSPALGCCDDDNGGGGKCLLAPLPRSLDPRDPSDIQ